MDEEADDRRISELIAGAAESDDAWRELVDILTPKLKQKLMARYKMLQPTDVDDILQETLTSIYRSLGQYDPAKSIYPWAYTILLNRAADWQRKKKRSPKTKAIQHSAEPAVHSPTGADTLAAAETNQCAIECFRRLPDRYQQVLTYRLFDKLSVIETAKAMSTSEGSVRGLQLRALKRLKELIEKNC